ncbi:MAG: ubiquinone/menaquinone biosynthesis methyltransferase [Dehalococcoidales bacterium]|nr:ubiquinone/menaquinone biosynthesis methyltransferase [Dehalococcoidales bacterium]
MAMEIPNPSRKSEPLHGMFTAVPPSYDLINHVVSLGMDRRWRRLAAVVCLEEKPRHVLDLGCGTGDLTISIARLADEHVEITGLDYSQPMLERARKKADRAGVGEKTKFIHGEATNIPFPDGHLDCVGISFAFRNLTYKTPLCLPHLAEVKRVLKPGGRYVIVESSQPENRVIRALFHLYMRTVAQSVGTIISANRGAYRYLAESMSRFYTQAEVREMLLSAGFRSVSYRPLLLGAVGMHVAIS